MRAMMGLNMREGRDKNVPSLFARDGVCVSVNKTNVRAALKYFVGRVYVVLWSLLW